MQWNCDLLIAEVVSPSFTSLSLVFLIILGVFTLDHWDEQLKTSLDKPMWTSPWALKCPQGGPYLGNTRIKNKNKGDKNSLWRWEQCNFWNAAGPGSFGPIGSYAFWLLYWRSVISRWNTIKMVSLGPRNLVCYVEHPLYPMKLCRGPTVDFTILLNFNIQFQDCKRSKV